MGQRLFVFMAVLSIVLLIGVGFLSYKIITGPAPAVRMSPAEGIKKADEKTAVVKTAADVPASAKEIALPDQADMDSAVRNAESVIARSPESAQAESAYFVLGSSYEKRGELLKARDAYQKSVEKFPASANVSKAQEAVDNLNIKILFSPPAGDFVLYEVQKGDTISRLAKKFKITRDLLVRVNDIRGDMLKYGKKLKIPKVKFGIIVDKSQNVLTLKANGEIIKTYKVATGKNSSTPVGTFTITDKITDPPWYPPGGGVIQAGDPKNVLGSRWLGISRPSYGIHGTIDQDSIGRSVTEGCVRMKNSDVEELFAIIPEGTEVIIMD